MDHSDARRRALQAARAVTLGLTMAAVGCASSHETADAKRDAGAEDCTYMNMGDTERCCELLGGSWSEGPPAEDLPGVCAVPGPFVPPSMHA